jgi:hypothetical protein
MKDGDCWGNWRYKKETLVLEYAPGGVVGFIYEFDLERCTTAANLLDPLFHFNSKGFLSAEDMRDLLCALRDLVHPQKNLCWSKSKSFDVAKYLSK